MAREWYNRPVNSGYTYIDGVTTGSYNNGSPNTYVKTWLEYKKLEHTSADILANQSRVDVKLYSQVIDGGSSSGMSIWTSAENFGYAGWDNANRSTYSCTFDFNDKKLNKFFDGILTIPHLADGTKTITLQAGFSTNGHTSAITGGSASGSVTLDAIETFKPTTISSVGGCNYGFPTTIELSRKASNLRELVTLSNGSKTFTLKTTSSDATVFQFTLPYKDGNDILVPNTTKPSPSYWTLSVTTYNGATQIGSAVTQSLTFNLREDDTTLAPTLTAEPTVQAYNDVVTDLGTDTAVAGYSKVNVIAQKASVSLKMGATVSSRVVTFANGSSASADQNNHISTVVYQSGNFGWTYTVTDSRGYTVQRSNTYPVLPYTAPTLKDVSVYRGNSSGTQTEDGSYIYAQATVSVSSVTHNRLVSFKGRVGYGGTEVSMTSGTRATLMTNASASNTYTIYLSVTDIFTNTTISRTIQAEDIPFNIKQGGHGVGIGTKNTVYPDEAVFGYLVRAQKGFKNLKVNGRIFGTGNLLDRKRVLQGGYADNQAISINPYMVCTPITRVKPNTTYNIFVNSLSTYRVVFYAIKCWQYGGTFIENIYTGNVYDYDFTTPSNCYYISINMRHMDNGALVPADCLELSMSEGNSVGKMEEYVMSGEEVTQTLRDMDLYKYSIRDRVFATQNMLDKSLITQGGFNGSTGEIVRTNNTAICCDQFIKVSPSTVYTCSWGYSNLQPAIFFYTSAKAFISYTQPTVGSNVIQVSFTTPSNCGYVRMSWDRVGSPPTDPSYIDYCQLELGTTKSDRQPYTMDGVEVAERLSYKKIYFTPQNCSANSGYDSCYYFKENGIVHLHIGAMSPTSKNTAYQMGTLPSGYRPKGATAICGWGSDNGTTINPFWVWTDSSGIIYFLTQGNYMIADLVFLAEA